MSYDYFKTPDPEEAKEVTWGDYGRAAGSTVAGIGAGSAGLMRQMFEAGQQPEAAQIFRGLQTASRNLGEDIEGGMTEEGRARNAAGVTSEKFWEHPVSSLALKAVGMSPYLVAAALPGALVGEGIAAMAATGGAAGWLAAGDVVDEITKKPDKMSDVDLRAQSELYNGFRDGGDEEAAARQKLNAIMVGAKPALAFILGAGTGVFGPAGNIVRGLGRGAAEEAAIAAGKTAASKGGGVLGKHGIAASALEGGATEFAEEGYGAYAAQKGEIEGGLRKGYDQSEMLDRALTGLVLGAGFGAASGIGGGKGKAKADEIRAKGAGEEATEIQAPAGQGQVAVPAQDTAAAPAKATQVAAAKGVTVGVDPAVEAALVAEQPPAAKAAPVEPPVPQPAAPPPAAAVQPAPQAPPPPPAAQPQQAPVSPPAGPAAGVTPEVTPSQQPAGVTPAKPQLDEATLTEMAKRGFLPEEAAQLTPEQIQQIIKTPVSAPPGAPTDVSARARTPAETSESPAVPSATGEVATAPNNLPPAEPSMPSVGEQVATAPGSTGSKPTGRVLQDISAEGKGKQKAQQVAQARREKEGLAEKTEKKVEKGKKASHIKAAEAERTTQSEQIFGEHTAAENEEAEKVRKLPVPKDKKERQALGERLKPLVTALKTKMELREDVATELPHLKGYYNTRGWKGQKPTEKEAIRWARSLPKRVGGKVAATGEARSVHTQYLRELVDIQKLLEKGESLDADQKRRVENFIAAYNEKAPDLIHMSRTEAGDAIAAAKRGATAEQAEGALAKIEAGGETKGAVKSAESTGAAAPPKVFTPEEKAAAIAEANARLGVGPKGAEILAKKPEAKPEPAPAPAKKPMPKKVAEKVAITKPETKITEKTKPEPTKPEPKPWKDMTEAERKEYQREQDKEGARITGVTPEEFTAARLERVAALGKMLKQEEKVEEKTETKPPEPEPVTSEVTEKAADESEAHTTATVAKETPQERIIRIKEEKADAEALAKRTAAAAERKAASEARAAKLAAFKAGGGKIRLNEEWASMTDEELDAEFEEHMAKLAAQEARNEEYRTRADAWLANERKLNNDSTLKESDIWETQLHQARDIFHHDQDAISPRLKTTDVLKQLDFSHLSAMPRYIQDFTRRRLAEILEHVPLYIVNSELMADALKRAHGTSPLGFHHQYGDTAHGFIAVRSDIVNDEKQFTHTVVHEAIHAALVYKLDHSKMFQRRVELLMRELDYKTTRQAGREHAEYALTDMHEFVAEAMSNPELQEVMASLTVSDHLAKQLALPTKSKPWSLWGAFTNKVREMLGLKDLPHVNSFLDEAMKVISPALEDVRGDRVRDGTYRQYPRALEGSTRALDTAALRERVTGYTADTGTNTKGSLARAKNKISTLWQMARRNEQYFGPSKILHRLFEARAFMERAKDTILEKYGGLKATVAIAKAERTHPEAMRLAKDVLFDGSLHDINIEGNNDHLGKDKLMGVQAKNEVARLQKAWADPRIDPVRNTIRNAVKFYKDIHNAVSRETINNILAEGNIHDPALAERIHNDGLTEADRETWADSKLVNALDQVKELKRRHGWYVPFRRYGDFSSTASHELSTPANATKINNNTLQFIDPTPKNGEYGNARARAAVKGYLRSNSHTPQGNKLTPHQIQKVWVDKNNPSEIIEKEQPDAIPAYRVAMQTQHTEFHATEAEALNSKALLAEAGLVGSRVHTREKAYQNDRNIQGAMGTILRSLEKQQRYKDADETQRAAMREMFHDLSLGMSGTTSIKNSMKQRRNVAGMSRDLGRVTGDYARMTTNHLAKLQHRPKIDKIFAEMREYKEAHKDDNDNIRREEVYQEFVDRVYGSAAKAADEHKPGVVSRLLQVTRLSFLAGPSYHLINAHEPWTTSLPVIGGDHGIAATTRALLDSYNIIGGRAGVMSGVRDMAKAYTNDAGFTNYVKLFKETIGKSKVAGSDKISRMQDVIDYMDARNLYSNASIFEVGKFANPEGNVAGRALDRADLMANQVGTAIEAVNRTVTGLTAYNLEYKKNGGNHEAAMHYAYTKAHETMGDYSNWNAAPLFNTKYGKPLLQFKKFPQKTYYLLGNIMGGALKGDPQAMKQFAGLMVTHGLVAGALGMPTEPFKLALVAANMVGATGFTPDDYEYAVRQLAARVAGQKGGEILSKGLYRGLGIEVSGRMGLDSLLVRGTPKSQKDTDIKTFLFDTMAGASGSFLLNQVQGAQAAFKGDWTTAIEKISPLRTVGDITKAAVGLSGEKKGAGGKTTQEQFTPGEALIRGLGFQPASASELGALRGTFKRESMRESGERTALTKAWVAATGADKVKAQRAVQRYNEGRPRDEQISQKDLTNAARRVKTEEKTTEHGITTSRRTEAIYERAAGVFNP